MAPVQLLPTLVLAFITLLLLLATFVFARQNRGKKRLPPGPYPWPFTGNMKQLTKLSRKLGGMHEALLELSKSYASPVIRLRIGRSDQFVVSGAKAIQAVLAADEFDGRPWSYFVSLRNMGLKKGITMNDGPNWREIRSWFIRSMKSVGFARREISEHITEELGFVLKSIQDGKVRQMKPIIVPAIINVLWTFAAGKKFDENKLQYFIDLMDRRAQAFDMMGGMLSAYPWIRHVAPEYSGYKLLVTLNNEFMTILMETIDEHKRNYVAGSEADLIDMFLNEMYAGKGPQAGFDEEQLVIILLDILLAGLNVTATTLDFLFLNMLINQDSQRLLHEEIDRVIGREKLPDLTDKSKMPYLEAVLLESQRLTPVVPIVGPRRVTRDTSLMGFELARDSVVIMNLHSIHADPELYPEPTKFKPERFANGAQTPRDDNILTFGKGHRQCPGILMAKTALFIIFIGVMQRYRLVPVPGQEPPQLRIKMGMTLSPQPYDVSFVPRDTTKSAD